MSSSGSDESKGQKIVVTVRPGREYLPSTPVCGSDNLRDELEHKVSDTLAYYHCRATNPKADHHRMGYHAFSESQREHLRANQAEAAAEMVRVIGEIATDAKADAWDEGARALMRAASAKQTLSFISPFNPYRAKSIETGERK